MIAAQQIAAWRTHAPWSSDLMVEQDYLLSRAVAAVFEDSFLQSHVAMRGGTVLHKGHLAPASRYSEDIDLVLIGDRSPGHVKAAIARVLQPLLGRPAESVLTSAQLAVRNLVARSSIIRMTYRYSPFGAQASYAQIKLEVNVNENRSLYPLVRVDVAVPDDSGSLRSVPVVSYDLDEMLGTKLRALLQREQGRDLFDFWCAWQASKTGHAAVKVNPARVGAAFRFYMDREGSSFSSAEVRRELERRMKSRKFLNDMNGYLPVGYSYSPQQAFDEFNSVFLPHLDG